MECCFQLQIDAGVDGLIVAGSLGEGPMSFAMTKQFQLARDAQKIA